MSTTKDARRQRIRRGIRNKITGTAERPRLSVFRSNKAIYAQLINDAKGITITSTNSMELGVKNNTTEDAKNVGTKLAEKAKAAGVNEVVFDRGGYRYHGQVKALADGAREGGLKF
jgi:large subunit ribosomal protein L18